MSCEPKNYLTETGIATSKSTPYHPTGNSQSERINQTVWKTLQLILKTKKLPTSSLEAVLPEALHALEAHIRFPDGRDAHIRFPDGRESTVSVTDLAPCPSETITFPESNTYHDEITDNEQPTTTSDSSPLHNCQRHDLFHQTRLIILSPLLPHPQTTLTRPNSSDSLLSQPLVQRRSSRNTRTPNRFGNNIYEI